MTRFELVPISVTEPIRVVTCAIGSSNSRAGIRLVCSSCRVAGISSATSGVVLINAEAMPIGPARRRNACRALAADDSSAHVARATTPVWTMPLAITSIAATVITPALLSPAANSAGGARSSTAPSTSAASSATIGSTRPEAIAASVVTTSAAATQVMSAGAPPDPSRSAGRRPPRRPCRRHRRRRGRRGPATAPSIARRWSPWAGIVPPRRPPVPRTTKPSSVASMSAPRPRRPSTTVAIRSDSLRRSSCAPVTTVSPSAKQPSRATSGSSSIASGTSCGSTVVPTSGPEATSSSQTGSSSGISPGRGGSRSPTTTAPIRSAIRTKPGAGPVRAHVGDDDPRALDQDRRGDVEGGGGRVARHVDRAELELVVLGELDPVAVARDPGAGAGEQALGVVAAAARARSPSSCPEASRPAISTHDLTCADATGSVYSIPRSGMPCTVKGARRPSCASIQAPISRSGMATRSTGRRRIDSSPSNVHSPSGLAGEPAGREPHQRAGVADVDVRLAGRAQPGPADGQRAAVRALLDQRAAARAPRSASSGCRPPRGSP